MTIEASSMSWWCSASSVRSSALTTRSSAPSACASSACSSCRKWIRAGDSAISPLADLAGDVVLRALVLRVGEDLAGGGVLDDGARAVLAVVVELDREEGGHV